MRKVTPVSATKTRKVMRPLLLEDDGSMDAAVVVGIMVLFVRGDVNERSIPFAWIPKRAGLFFHSLVTVAGLARDS